MLQLIRIIELIEKKDINEILIEYRKKLNNYNNIDKELIENKINLIKLNRSKYISVEKTENIQIYKYENEIKIYIKTYINKEKIKEILKDIKEKEIFIKEKNRKKKIKKEDIYKLNKDFEIIIKT
jgi:hypothetical protein